MRDKVVRKLYYYDVNAEILNSEVNRMEEVTDFQSTIVEAFQQIKAKIERNRKHSAKYMVSTDSGNKIFFIIDEISTDAIAFKIVLSKMDALPFIETEGNLENIREYIGDDQNVAELSHCVLFPQHSIIGIEFNYYGARKGAISQYVPAMCSAIDNITCTEKLNLDAYKRLIEGRDFSLFNIAIKGNSRAYYEVFANKSVFGLGGKNVPDVDVLEVSFKKRKTKKNEYTGFEGPLSLDEIKKLVSVYRDDIQKFIVSQEAVSKDLVDLLSDKLVCETAFIKKDGRAIDSAEVYREIKAFFNLEVINYREE